ncbi:hypothetical protein LCGC14_2187400 [marine sediment metagenome]|uniref:Uncharacterized protein n=1 Tax=marine sediment metagenome TaxID=412755 RepID=A0A0F9FXY0_9ZZZZ
MSTDRMDRLLGFINNHKSCPYFKDPPVSDDDLDFIAPLWEFCEHEEQCEEVDNCPILPDSPMFPRWKQD